MSSVIVSVMTHLIPLKLYRKPHGALSTFSNLKSSSKYGEAVDYPPTRYRKRARRAKNNKGTIPIKSITPTDSSVTARVTTEF